MSARSSSPSGVATTMEENINAQRAKQTPSSLENAAVAEEHLPAQQEPVFTDDNGLSRVISAPYTVFPRSVKIAVTGMVAVASMISPMTANIYFPALNSISDRKSVV